jgi:hypothetical protein
MTAKCVNKMVELRIIERWDNTQDFELFYNTKDRRITFKKQNLLSSKDLNTNEYHPYIDLQPYR